MCTEDCTSICDGQPTCSTCIICPTPTPAPTSPPTADATGGSRGVPFLETPGPETSGEDLDGDGNLDYWEYLGCFEDLPAEVEDLDLGDKYTDENVSAITVRRCALFHVFT